MRDEKFIHYLCIKKNKKMNNDPYNFEETTIVVNCQILPQTESQERRILITVGIKNEVPLCQVSNFNELELPPLITAMLEEFQQQLPIRKEAFLLKQKQAKIEKLPQEYKPREVTIPNQKPTQVGVTNSQKINQQYTLF